MLHNSDENLANEILLNTLASSESDVKAGRVAPIEETFDDIRKKLNEANAKEE